MGRKESGQVSVRKLTSSLSDMPRPGSSALAASEVCGAGTEEEELGQRYRFGKRHSTDTNRWSGK